jgi:hypothetical protein
VLSVEQIVMCLNKLEKVENIIFDKDEGLILKEILLFVSKILYNMLRKIEENFMY